MPVRPLTEGEYKIALGQPISSWLMILGATQGLLTHLQFNGVALSAKTVCPTPVSKITLPLFMVAGAGIGAAVGATFYGDDQLRRLFVSHLQDRKLNTAAQKYNPGTAQ